MCPHDTYRDAEECSACMAPSQPSQTVVNDLAYVLNDLAGRHEVAMHRIDELENDLRIANEATLVLTERCAQAEAKVEDLEEELRTVHAPDDYDDV